LNIQIELIDSRQKERDEQSSKLETRMIDMLVFFWTEDSQQKMKHKLKTNMN